MALFQFVFAILTSLAPAPVAALTSNTITLAMSPNPSVFGSAVTLTANVSPPAATGRVTFYDGVAILGIATLSGGQAALTTKLLPSGTRTLKAYYSGDATFAASTSLAITQTVSTTAQNGLQPALNYAVSNGPIFLAVGDFNGDGRADLAVANSDDKVSVLLGNGDGTFQAAVNYSAGNNDELRGVAVADFNGDGRADLVVANYNSFTNTWGIAVLLGNGDGTFQAPVTRNTQGIPIFVAVGDFNGDGRADVAIANYRGQGVSVLLGNGDGTFGSEVQY